eukprot:scaffold289508_cov42-Tisochrysis_lutea.AAC.3
MAFAREVPRRYLVPERVVMTHPSVAAHGASILFIRSGEPCRGLGQFVIAEQTVEVVSISPFLKPALPKT